MLAVVVDAALFAFVLLAVDVSALAIGAFPPLLSDVPAGAQAAMAMVAAAQRILITGILLSDLRRASYHC